jgi:hypothetical protein
MRCNRDDELMLWPPSNLKGDFSYTVTTTLGRRNMTCKIEVLVRSRAFRVSVPKMDKGEKPNVSWSEHNGNLDEAWSAVKDRALAKLRAMHPTAEL